MAVVVMMMMCEVFDGIVRCWEKGGLRGGEGVKCCYMYNTMVCVCVCVCVWISRCWDWFLGLCRLGWRGWGISGAWGVLVMDWFRVVCVGWLVGYGVYWFRARWGLLYLGVFWVPFSCPTYSV